MIGRKEYEQARLRARLGVLHHQHRRAGPLYLPATMPLAGWRCSGQVCLQRSDLSTLGAAVVGGGAAALFQNERALGRRFAKPLATVRPRPGAEAAYRRGIEVYRELFERLAPVYRLLAGGPS